MKTANQKAYNKIAIFFIMIVLLSTAMPATAEAATAAIKKPAQVASVKATAAGTAKVKLTWARAKNATGYQIYMATSKNGTYKKIKTVKPAKAVAYTKAGLKSNTKYWFKVRAYRTTGKKTVYGKFSTAKSATTKHSHAWADHTTKITSQRQVGTEPVYETAYACPLCDYTDATLSVARHLSANHTDEVGTGEVTIARIQVQTGTTPVYEAYNKTVVDYRYCKTCKVRK